jgi:hypothetical protein
MKDEFSAVISAIAEITAALVFIFGFDAKRRNEQATQRA